MNTLAAQGSTRPAVYRIPRVGILSTGSEIAESENELQHGKIRNANRYALSAALKAIGCQPVYLGLAGDSVPEICSLIRRGLCQCDAVISTGGVSVGDYDLTAEAMEQIGAKILFRGISAKPGIRNWKKAQKNLDAAIEADRIKHELDVSKMKNSEILERTIEEVKEAEPSNDTPVQSVIMRHMDIEDRYFFNALPKRIMRKYSFRRNVKIGRIEYDGIAVSSVDNTDIIFEIKYWEAAKNHANAKNFYRALVQRRGQL